LGGMIYLLGLEKVSPGYVGVKVNLYGGAKGVSNEVLGTGRWWIGPNASLYQFPTFQQNYPWTAAPQEGSKENESFDIQTLDGQTVNCDIAITYQYEVAKISDLFQKFREGNEEIRDKQLRNFVRNAMNSEASQMTVEDIYGPKKVSFIKSVEKDVRDQVAPEGIDIVQLSLIGAFRLPPGLTQALNDKNTAIQKAQQIENEVAQSRAMSEKKVAIAQGDAQSIIIMAKAQAEANKIIAASLTKELIESRKVDKWDGQYPQFVSGGSAGGIMIDTSGLVSRKALPQDTDKTAATK
jgi:regulator of protease activity HflC (stomatin/prohibitin superfamily)